MKEYRGFKYYELDEVKHGCPMTGHEGISFPDLMVVSDTGISINTGLSIEKISQSDNPEELIESTSKRIIDEYIAIREHKTNK